MPCVDALASIFRRHGGLIKTTQALFSAKHYKALQRANAGGFFFSECQTRLCHTGHDRWVSTLWEGMDTRKKHTCLRRSPNGSGSGDLAPHISPSGNPISY